MELGTQQIIEYGSLLLAGSGAWWRMSAHIDALKEQIRAAVDDRQAAIRQLADALAKLEAKSARCEEDRIAGARAGATLEEQVRGLRETIAGLRQWADQLAAKLDRRDSRDTRRDP